MHSYIIYFYFEKYKTTCTSLLFSFLIRTKTNTHPSRYFYVIKHDPLCYSLFEKKKKKNKHLTHPCLILLCSVPYTPIQTLVIILKKTTQNNTRTCKTIYMSSYSRVYINKSEPMHKYTYIQLSFFMW